MDNIFKITFITFLFTILSACSFGQSDTDYLKKAEQYLSNSDTQSALIELKNAVKANQANPQAHYLLGKTYFETNQFAEAAKELRKARTLNVDNNLTMPLLAQALVKSNQLSDIGFLPTSGLERINIATVLAAQAEAKIAKKEFNQAQQLIDDALLAYPSSTYALNTEAKFYLAQGDTTQAAIALNKSLQQEKKNFDTQQLNIEISLQNKDLEKADILLTELLKQQPNSLINHLKRAQTRVMLGQYAQAQIDLDRVLKVTPENPLANFLQGLAYLKTAKPDLAQPAFELAIRHDDLKFPGAEYGLGLIHYQKNNLSQAKAYTKQFLRSAPNATSGLKLMALIDLKEKNFSRAESGARKIIASNAEDNDALGILSSALIQQGKNDEGIEILSRLAEKSPQSATDRLKLGIGLMSSGHSKDAQHAFEIAYSLNPELPQTNISLVLSLLKQKEYDKALSTAQSYMQANPDMTGPKNLLGTVYLAKGDTTNAKDVFNQVLNIDVGNPAANEKLAQIAIQQKELKKARGYFNNILKAHSNHLQSLHNLAALDALEKNTKGFIAHLTQAIDAHPDAMQPKLVLSRYYLAQNDPEKALLTINKNTTPNTSDPATLLIAAMAHLQQNKPDASVTETSRILNNTPDMLQALLLRAKAFRALSKNKAAKADLNKVIKINQKIVPAYLELASLALQEQDNNTFKKQLNHLTEIAPEHPNVIKLQIIDAKQSGQTELTLSLLNKLYQKHPSTENVNGLAFQLFKAKRSDEGIALLNNWLDIHPNDAPVILNLANYQLGQDSLDAATLLYEKVLTIQENNVLALNNLAWLYKGKQPEKALELVNQALALTPDTPAINDTLATVLLANNRPEDAERAIKKALKADNKNPSLLYHQAQILVALKRNDDAKIILEKLIIETKVFSEHKQANQLLNSLK